MFFYEISARPPNTPRKLGSGNRFIWLMCIVLRGS